MARPKKVKTNTTPDHVSAEVIEPKVEVIEPKVEVIEPKVEVIEAPTSPTVPPEPIIMPESDKFEMDRYFRVINNREQASRIMDAISHQREVQMWGVHQYVNNNSRNSYSKSFYFKNRDNAAAAVAHAKQILGEP